MAFRARQSGFALAACLTILNVSAAGQASRETLATIFNFPNSYGQPWTGVVLGNGGVLYGTMAWPNGAIYSLTPQASGGWTYTILYTFGPAGSFSVSPNGLAIDSHGVLYGTNFAGGNTTGACGVHLAGCGSVYSLTPPTSPGGPWTETTLYNFAGVADGAAPGAGVTIGSDGVLYGTAELRGSGNGTVFSLTPPASAGGAWTEATLYTFAGGADGAHPAGNLAIDSHGVLYGTTNFGGGSNHGTVFSLTPSPGGAWTETVLSGFTDGGNGSTPSGGVLRGPDGILYGSTSYGGTANGGVVYALAPPSGPGGSWTETALHKFSADGSIPLPGPLAWGNDGNLYGTTSRGGANREGSIFALSPPASSGGPWTFLDIYSFAQPGGTNPPFGFYTGGEVLAVDASGLVYGATLEGGTSSFGTVFALHP